MKRLAFSALVLAACLAGCSNRNPYTDAPKALDKMTPEELCAFYGKYRDNPDLSVSGKAIATNQMKAKGARTLEAHRADHRLRASSHSPLAGEGKPAPVGDPSA